MDLYLIIVVVLFALAISDLVVGVSNDAVNFLNSAIGSKVAPRHIVMIVASIGILVGTTFSSGLMEVARKGIFHPDQFLFPEIMIIFLAVMLTDVLLLDLFNTFALPTSTTVSIVFELLGAAVAVSFIKIIGAGDSISAVSRYINSDQALFIISGILLSVVVSFTFGAIVQFITRLIFTFDFERKIKRYGAIWGGIALTAITYFILIKGAKGASFIDKETMTWIKSNTETILLINFAFWAVLMQILMLVFKTNILKVIVIVGTFALALAFAANDLVNFIGVPLAGLSSYTASTGVANPETLAMEALKKPVETNTFLLLIAGSIMVVTLWFSKKAQSVTKTEVNLGRQSEGFERFESSLLARQIVRIAKNVSDILMEILPDSFRRKLDARFAMVAPAPGFDGKIPSFDLLRASVNLMMASILISFATSLKLPLSTTYVTFMVAMGTSLSDRAWGRESAVYRVNGVITVVGGWFFTALCAFTVAFTFAFIVNYGGLAAITILILLAMFFIYRTHIIHTNREKESASIEENAILDANTGDEAVRALMGRTTIFLASVSDNLDKSYSGLFSEDRTVLKEARKNGKAILKDGGEIVTSLFQTVQHLDKTEVKKINRMGKLISAIQGIANNAKTIATKCLDHIDNNHAKPDEAQEAEIKKSFELFKVQVEKATALLTSLSFDDTTAYEEAYNNFQANVDEYHGNQVERIKDAVSTPKNSVLFINLLNDMDKISEHMNAFTKTTRKIYSRVNGNS